MVDDDCDNLIDCLDPDCPQPCPPAKKDPTDIRFGPGLDRLRSKAVLEMAPRFWAVLIGFILLGYLCMGRSFAYWGIRPANIYVGEIVHKGERHPGAHQPIVDRETWAKVQSRLAENARRQKAQTTAASPSLLAGLVFDEEGQPLTPTHANKKGRRYRYYVSQALVNGDRHSDENARPGSWRLPASVIEELVVNRICDLLLHPARLADELASNALAADQVEAIFAGARRLGNAIRQVSGTDRILIRKLVHRITIASDSVNLDLDRPALLSAIVPHHQDRADDKGAHQATLSLTIPVSLKRRGSELKLVLCDRPQPLSLDQVLICNLARGYAWRQQLLQDAVELEPSP